MFSGIDNVCPNIQKANFLRNCVSKQQWKASLVSFEILPEIALRFCLIVTSLTTSLKNSLKSAKSAEEKTET